MKTISNTFYSLSKKVRQKWLRHWLLRVSSDIDWTPSVRLCLLTQLIFLTELKKTKRKFKYIFNAYNFVDQFFSSLSSQLWNLSYFFIWLFEKLIQIAHELHEKSVRWKMPLENFPIYFWTKRYILNTAVFRFYFKNCKKAEIHWPIVHNAI